MQAELVVAPCGAVELIEDGTLLVNHGRFSPAGAVVALHLPHSTLKPRQSDSPHY